MDGEEKRKENREDGKKEQQHVNATNLVRNKVTLISEIEYYIQWVTQTCVAGWEAIGGNNQLLSWPRQRCYAILTLIT